MLSGRCFRETLIATFALVALVGAARPAHAEDETQPCDANGQAMTYGDVLAGCTIEAPADLDIFTFVGAAGDNATIIVTETGGSGLTAVCLEVRAPDNSLIAGPTCSNITVRFDFGPLALAGVHQIIVTESGSDHTIPFNLGLERMLPLRAPTPVGPGDTITGRQILPAADLDTFAFNASIGDQLRLIVTETGGSGLTAVCVEVRGPGNISVVALTCNNITVDLTLPPAAVAGAYQVIVTESGNEHTIPYNLSLNCLSGTCAHRPPACIVDPGYAGGTLTLDFTLGTPDPAEWHVAILAAGQVFTFWRIPLPAIDPAVSFPLSIPGFPGIGTIGFLSTLTAGGDLVCTDLRRVDTTP